MLIIITDAFHIYVSSKDGFSQVCFMLNRFGFYSLVQSENVYNDGTLEFVSDTFLFEWQ